METQPLLQRVQESSVSKQSSLTSRTKFQLFCFSVFVLLLLATTAYYCSLRETRHNIYALRSSEQVVENNRVPPHDVISRVVRPQSTSAYLIGERNGGFRVLTSPPDENSSLVVMASATYSRNVSGWNYFTATAAAATTQLSSSSPTNDHPVDPKQYTKTMEALGYLEGYLTCLEMRDFYANFYSGLFDGGDPSDDTLDFLRDNYEWMTLEASKHYASSDYWLAVKGVLSQIEGMLDGVLAGCPMTDGDLRKAERSDVTGLEYLSGLERPTILNLLLVNANGDLYQIADKFNDFDGDSFANPRDDDYHKKKGGKDKVPASGNIDHARRRLSLKRRRRGRREDHCSAVIKVLAGNADVVFGHSTWDDYQSLGPRTIKTYTLPALSANLSSTRVDFSSSPCLLSSVDDFYLVRRDSGERSANGANLAVMETTIDVYDTSVLDAVDSRTVLSWVRAKVANQLSSTGSHWAQTFAKLHSGTYANQWMVLDLSLFRPGQTPPAGFLQVLEEIPGLVHYEDATAELVRAGYWASYNEPYFHDIALTSGSVAECRRDPNSCYLTDPRSLIFKDRQSTVTDVRSLQRLLGYNRFQYDGHSGNDSCSGAVACRGDLQPDLLERYPFGSIDSKASSALLVSDSPVMVARLGPSNDDQPTFCWSAYERNASAAADGSSKHKRDDRTYSHLGQPDCYNFPWQRFPPA